MKYYKTKYDMTINDVPLEYRIPKQGTYNASINKCINCNNDINLSKIVGFFEYLKGIAVLIECEHCFEKQFYHVGEEMLETCLIHIRHTQNER